MNNDEKDIHIIVACSVMSFTRVDTMQSNVILFKDFDRQYLMVTELEDRVTDNHSLHMTSSTVTKQAF